MRYPIVYIFIFLIITIGCKKEDDPEASVKYLDIEDAYGLVIANFQNAGKEDIGLFKIMLSDNLKKIDILNEAKLPVTTNKKPVALYRLDEAYFLITYQTGAEPSVKYDSYLVRRMDGKLQKLLQTVLPKIKRNGNYEIDYNVDAIRKDNNSNYYFYDGESYVKLNLKDSGLPVFETIMPGEAADSSVTVDFIGNILLSQKLYLTNGSAYTLKSAAKYSLIPMKNSVNYLYWLGMNTDSIKFVKLSLLQDEVDEQTLTPGFKNPSGSSRFINSYLFANCNKTIALASDALFEIAEDSVRQLRLSGLNLNIIEKSCGSAKYYYIYGDDAVGYKVLAKIDPTSRPHVYTQIIAPNKIKIEQISVSQNDNIVFSGTRLQDGKHLFGYIPSGGNIWEVIDDQGFRELQVMVR